MIRVAEGYQCDRGCAGLWCPAEAFCGCEECFDGNVPRGLPPRYWTAVIARDEHAGRVVRRLRCTLRVVCV
jgi:hypothetical protein